MRPLVVLLFSIVLISCSSPFFGGSESSVPAEASYGTSKSGAKTKSVPGFGGVMAKKYDESQEWWAEEDVPGPDAPNVIIT